MFESVDPTLPFLDFMHDRHEGEAAVDPSLLWTNLHLQYASILKRSNFLHEQGQLSISICGDRELRRYQSQEGSILVGT